MPTGFFRYSLVAHALGMGLVAQHHVKAAQLSQKAALGSVRVMTTCSSVASTVSMASAI